jgi:hypothetical protein
MVFMKFDHLSSKTRAATAAFCTITPFAIPQDIKASFEWSVGEGAIIIPNCAHRLTSRSIQVSAASPA